MTLTSTPRGLVEVRGRFHRSVQLVRDWQDHDLSGYLITPTVRGLIVRIVGELERPGGTRAWSITGPYGTGKSSFALFLTKLLADQLGGRLEMARLREDFRIGASPFLPILLVGQRNSLKPALLTALAGALMPVDEDLATEVAEASRITHIDDARVVSCFERSAAAALRQGYGGLIIILDEFGKFLEHTAINRDSEDLLVMQALAETASRSKAPMSLITILHTGFADYLDYLDVVNEVQRAEWQKVQGRFTDVAFQEPPEQLLKLIGEALMTRFPVDLEERYRKAIAKCLQAEALGETRARLPIVELLPACVPLHPVTATLLWPLFRSKLAQNERSLFSFLTSHEPFGLQDFLATAPWHADMPPLYRPDRLYDYIKSSLGTSAYRGDAGRRWLELDDALERIGAEAPPLAQSVVKVLGLLWMYGAPVGLRATEEAIALALDDAKGAREALAYLKRMSVVVYRKFEEAYALWEGSDVDLDSLYEEARHQLGSGNLAHRLKRLVELRAIVARAHYIKTGTFRFFSVDVVDGVEAALRDRLIDSEAVQPGDGEIIFVLTSRVADRDTLMAQALLLTGAETDTGRLRILAFPQVMAGLEEALEEVESWRWVQDKTPALQGDKAAKRELEVRLRFARQRLEDIAGRVLGLRGYPFEPTSSEWVQGGNLHTPGNARTFLGWLSKLCDDVYAKAPPLHNELLNRDSLSSSAKAALNRLIKRVVVAEDEHRFGIAGTPAEVSMYEAMVAAGGFHHHHQGRWWLDEPNEAWQGVWQAILSFLERTRTGRRPLLELYGELKRPPYGMREGPLPLLLCTLLLAKKSDVVLYYNGLFQPDLYDETLELLVRVPESFEIQQLILSEESQATLEAIGEVLHSLNLHAGEEEGSPLLRIVRPLVVAVAKLPPYSKNTRRLDPPEAAELRDAALNAKDPHALLLEDIPSILGVKSETPEARQELVSRLRDCLVALQRAYPNLLDQIEGQLKHVFDLGGATAQAVQEALRYRAQPLKGYATDPALALFINEAARQDDRDWREAMGRAVAKGKPPKTWGDADLVDFQVKLRQLASDFVRLEELVAEKNASGADQVIRIGVLNKHLSELRQTISLHQDRMPIVTDVADRITNLLSQYQISGPDENRIKLAALAQAVMHYLQEKEEHERS